MTSSSAPKFALITLAAFVGVASASHLAAPLAAAVVPAAVNTGSSSQYRSQDNLGQYAFGYDEAGATGGSFRHEKSDAYGNRVGSYGLRGADGRVRIVNYVADANGYRANVQTNEPGTESRDTAGVAVNKALVAAPAPVAFAAPLVGPAPLPVPIAAAPLPAPAPAPVPVAAAAPLPLAAAAAPLSLALPAAAGPLFHAPAGPFLAPAAPLVAAPPLAAAPVPLPAPVGFGFGYVNQHFAPLPVAY